MGNGPLLNLSADDSELKELILGQLNQTHREWTGKGLPAPPPPQCFSLNLDDVKAHIQDAGKAYGCHTCLSKIQTDRNQPWIADHIPPWGLSDTVRNEALSDRTQVNAKFFKNNTLYLFPQCDVCEHSQSFYVRALNGGVVEKWGTMVQSDKKLILGGWQPKEGTNCIKAKNRNVDPAEGLQIQELGRKLGCHSCGSKFPSKIYIADHTFPREFCTAYMEQIFKLLSIPYPKSFEFRPQCARCSTLQGGKMSEVTKRARDFVGRHHILSYKD